MRRDCAPLPLTTIFVPAPAGREEPSVALHHSRMTDGSKPTAHKGSFPILSHRTCAEVAALQGHEAGQ